MNPLTEEQKALADQYWGLAEAFLNRYCPKHHIVAEEWLNRMRVAYIAAIRNFKEDRINKDNCPTVEKGIKSYVTGCLIKARKRAYMDLKKVPHQLVDTWLRDSDADKAEVEVGKFRYKGQWEKVTQLPHETPESELTETVEQIYRFWNPREKQIGDLLKEGLTLADIGKIIGVSRERVRQILEGMRVKASRYEEASGSKANSN